MRTSEPPSMRAVCDGRRRFPTAPELPLGVHRIGHPCRVSGAGSQGVAGVSLRPRVPADLDACEQLARRVHAGDGYPPYMPNGDFVGFLDSPDAICAWVATDESELVGHVALHSNSSKAVMDLA